MTAPKAEAIQTEVCIVGAGPAGTAASLTLSKKGISHLVVDAEVFPRHKPCGDIITTGVLRALNQIDPEILSDMKQQGLLNPIWHTLTYPPNGKPINIDFLPFDGKKDEPGCFSISRKEMDQVLVNHMLKPGFADFRQKFRVASLKKTDPGFELCSDSGEVIQTKLLIIATGSGNSLLKQLGLEMPKSDSAIGIRGHFEGLDWNPKETGLFLHPDIMPGGLYITPLPDGTCNVNLVMSLNKVSDAGISLRERFDSVVKSIDVLDRKFANAKRIGNFEGSMLFLGTRRRIVAGDSYLVAGDSAGLIEFFSGNGIPQAFHSGRIAGETAISAIENQNFSAGFLSNYEEKLYQKIKLNYAGGRIVFPLLHRPYWSKQILQFLNFLSGRPQTNAMLRDLLYEKNPGKILRKPGFYYKLFFKREAVS